MLRTEEPHAPAQPALSQIQVALKQAIYEVDELIKSGHLGEEERMDVCDLFLEEKILNYFFVLLSSDTDRSHRAAFIKRRLAARQTLQ